MASSAKSKPSFIPLSLTSQCNNEDVLYYNANAAQDSIYECATGRLQAVINLAESFYKYKDAPPSALRDFSVVVALLLDDVRTLFEQINPMAIALRSHQAGKAELG